MRQASYDRRTKETEISVELNVDGTGIYTIDTGIGFLDHMLEQLSRHSLIDLTVRAKGDTHIDFTTRWRIPVSPSARPWRRRWATAPASPAMARH